MTLQISDIRYHSTTRFKHTFYTMTLQISDIRYHITTRFKYTFYTMTLQITDISTTRFQRKFFETWHSNASSSRGQQYEDINNDRRILRSLANLPCYHNWYRLLGTFLRSRIAPINFVMSVCLFARISAVPSRWIPVKFDIGEFF